MTDAPSKLAIIHRRFLNRTDRLCFSAPWGKPCPINSEGVLDAALAAHLQGDEAPAVTVLWIKDGQDAGTKTGRFRLGTYCPAADGTTVYGCVDCDGGGRHGHPLADPLAVALRVVFALERLRIRAHLERSGGGAGWHVWVFFKTPVPAAKLRRLLFAVLPSEALLQDGAPADPKTNKGIEVFPKQDAIASDGIGNQVWLPWWSGAKDGGNLFYKIGPDREVTPYDPEDLEAVAEADLDRALAALPAPKQQARTVFTYQAEPVLTDREKALSALASLPASLAYDEWLRVGMALHSVDSSDAMRDDWDRWSRSCPEKYQEGECRKKWASFKSGDVTLGTLIHMAKQHGWTPPARPRGRETTQTASTSKPHTQNGDGRTTEPPAVQVPCPPWPEPAPLDAVPDAPPFPLDVLPTPLRRFVQEVSSALPCPPDYVAVPLLVMAGGAIGASRAVAIKDGHVQRAALYAAVVGSPGTAKTPALEIVVEPAHDTGERLHEKWEGSMAEYARKMAEYDAATKPSKPSKKSKPEEARIAAQGAHVEKPDKPVLLRVTINESTCESVAPILKDNCRGVVMVRDELIGWVQAMNQYREGGKGADQQFWLSAWSGTTIEVDRKKTHDLGPLRIRKPFIAVVGGLTPDKLPTLRGDKPRQRAEQDGFFDRILTTYPKELAATEENWMAVCEETLQLWRDAYAKLRTLAMVPVQEGTEIKSWRPFVLKLTAGARRAWQAFTRKHAEERNAEDFPAHLVGPWSKLRGYCARLALIVHLLRWACETDAPDGDAPVDDEGMERAARLVAYFMGHARKVYAAADCDPKAGVAKRLLDWIQRGDLQTFNRRNAYRACRGPHCKTVADIDPILDMLEQHGYIRPLPGPDKPALGRKPAPTYEANPAILGRNGRNGRNSAPEASGVEPTGISVHSVHSVQGSQEASEASVRGDAWEPDNDYDPKDNPFENERT